MRNLGNMELCKLTDTKCENLAGRRFGKLVALEFVGFKRYPNSGGKLTIWRCKCDCGKDDVLVPICSLKNGTTKSCGCSKVKYGKESHFYKHGECNSRLYSIYEGMKKRCYCKTDKCYEIYGGKGIKVCEEWSGENGYINFRNWAYENGYDDNASPVECSIDRIDVNGDYSPDNCRWANATEQANNRTSNKYIVYKGKSHTLAEWSRILGVSYSILQHRLRSGWSVEDAIEIVKLKANRKYQTITRNNFEDCLRRA